MFNRSGSCRARCGVRALYHVIVQPCGQINETQQTITLGLKGLHVFFTRQRLHVLTGTERPLYSAVT